MATGFFYHPDFLKHETGAGHPERAERLAAILEKLKKEKLFDTLIRPGFGPARLEALSRVHSIDYLNFLAKTEEKKFFALDPDTVGGNKSWHAAKLAAGAVVQAVEDVDKGKLKNAFCAVRPPGHHAERDRAMGFCLVNNVAVAAAHLTEAFNYERVLIVDWDVHHGNGTQNIFYSDPKVFYYSSHQHPFYPGTGAAFETGAGAGKGTTLNFPLAAGSGDAEFLSGIEEKLIPAAQNFRPEFIIISAGFDAHAEDPLAGLNVTDEGFKEASRLVKKLAEEECGGRLVSVLEGGYDLEVLGRCVCDHIKILCEE
ncbi:MAG TPA: histone deacetylase [Verrucomicrobiae bacterium]|nr:histone deacetylase [Verrucomicrobiae bacterium]